MIIWYARNNRVRRVEKLEAICKLLINSVTRVFRLIRVVNVSTRVFRLIRVVNVSTRTRVGLLAREDFYTLEKSRLTSLPLRTRVGAGKHERQQCFVD